MFNAAVRNIVIATALTLVSGCSPSERQQSGDDLRSDMPLRDAKYYMNNKAEREQMQSVCQKWRTSQRPPASWPSVVVSNCNNVDTANELLQAQKDREEFKKGMGL